ncbi:MAG: 23S rRNA pseudouridine1911/1915/1917 synthase [Pseudohongiellaceae bacterium]|jgi:23S rRNA pseudouridine1911/1915/1917 synthase
MTTQISLSASVPDTLAGNRLDQIAAQLFPDYSRSRLQTWIKEGSLLVNSQPLRPRDRLDEGDLLEINATMPTNERWAAEELPVEIVFEDEDLVIINKAAGVVVHPAAGNREGTLLNGLLSKIPQLEELPRAGIIHRLDKDTTGLLIVAKNLIAHTRLVAMLQLRNISREYQAVVQGIFTGGGRIEQPLGRHPINRKKRAVVREGKEAITHYKIAKRFRCHTLLDVKLETGRTHQIRVHMASIKSPIVGDQLYGGRLQMPRACHANLALQLQQFKRQALHARRLAFLHPISDEPLEFIAELPDDMLGLLAALAEDKRAEQA